MLGFLLHSSWVWKTEEERVFSIYRQKCKKNCLFCGASAHLFPVTVGTGNLRDALRLVRSRFLLICVSWLLKLTVGILNR